MSSRRTTDPPKDIHHWIFQKHQKFNSILYWQNYVFWKVFDLEEEPTCSQETPLQYPALMALPLLFRNFQRPSSNVPAAFCNGFCCVDIGNRWRKCRVVVAMKRFLLRNVKNYTIKWIASATLGWCGKGLILGGGAVCREGEYRCGFLKPPAAFPISDRANSSQLQHRPTPGQGWAPSATVPAPLE